MIISRTELRERAQRVAQVAAEHADEVDAAGAFPQAGLDAARAEGLLGLLIAEEEGGLGAGFTETAEAITIVGRACANLAMVLAMHHNQVAAITRHGSTDWFADKRRRIAGEGLLVASATTEKGIGGDTRRSSCHVSADADGRFELVKDAPVISYAEYADVILVTARRNADAAPSDQSLVWLDQSDLTLERTGDWDTLGLRGTCSHGYLLTGHSTVDAILPDGFATISAQTMLPGAHVLWSAAWLGIAEGAMSKARTTVRKQARSNPDVTPPAALRVAEADLLLQQLRGAAYAASAQLDSLAPPDPELTSVSNQVAMNGLKVLASTLLVEIVTQALLVVGINGYRLNHPMSLGRYLRDAHGAQLMVNNDRILGNSARLELMNRK